MEQLAELLETRAMDLGVTLKPAQGSALGSYLELLGKWNKKLNLVGPGTKDQWATRHVIDSLAPLQWVSAGETALDIGSGAGLPGIPLAVASPETRFTLLEPRMNRAAFLRNAVAVLKLRNVEVVNGRAEEMKKVFPLVIGRAVAAPDAFVKLAAHCVTPAGRLVDFFQSEPPALLGRHSRRVDWRSYTIGDEPQRSVGAYEVFHVEHF